MYATDFEYDGQYLSDYGFIICNIESSEGKTIVNSGSKITFNKTPINGGKYHSLNSVRYDECYTVTFEICKNVDVYEDLEITDEEYRDLIRWLNRKQFLPFHFDDENETVFFESSFQVDKIFLGGKFCGLQLTMETNSPFGYGYEQSTKWRVSENGKPYNLADCNDEIGTTYPDVKIKCNRSGDLEIFNETTNCRTIIKNCRLDETITIYGLTRIIETDNENHRKTLYNDFNFQFLNIENSFENRLNKISVSLPCEIEIKYKPIIK